MRAFLKTEGKSQGWLARELGVSSAYLSMILSGRRHPSLTVASKLEAVTGIPAREFAEAA